ncbi:MAG: beta-galactosidase [Chloroflexota bacterium]|nr:MAG: beta-galactosidase [Chloroflexota bacterium]
MFSQIQYGGDYNPDQWDESVWLEDARLMREAGVNLVSLGIFSWAKLEPASGQYDFAWLDRVMDLMHAHGVRVDLATPTASPPPWLVKQSPEILPVTADGVTLWHGARRHYCPNSSVYRAHAARIATRLAEHARAHPALTLWHVDNEYGDHLAECFCERCTAAFRVWLEARYQNLDNLNRAWSTAFWSQHYREWAEIIPPRRAPASVNPTQKLDWQRFCSDSFLACFTEQAKILRELTPNIPVTTNFMHFFKSFDYWKWAAYEDIVSNDHYPDHSDPEWMITAAMACDLMRSLKQGEPWLLMEQAPSAVNWRGRNAPKRPGEMRLGSYQAVARGANGIMFFQWRASQGGDEKFHSGMVPHVGTNSRIWREVKQLGNELRTLDALTSSRVYADVAIVFDWENWWALELESKPSTDLKLVPRVRAFYRELYRRNLAVDFVRPDADLSRYRLALAPHLYLVNDASVENLKRYVAQGGVLLLNFFSGIVDENDRVRLGGYPAPFRDMLGIWVEEFVPLMKEESNSIVTDDEENFACAFWSEVIHIESAEVLARYLDDFVADQPALTRHQFGKGVSYYLGTELEHGGIAWLMDRLCAEAKIQTRAAPRGVELMTRADDTRQWLFALNFSDVETEIPLDGIGIELLENKTVNGQLNLPARGVAVVMVPRT